MGTFIDKEQELESRIERLEAIVSKSDLSGGLNALPEGCTPTDARVLRAANHDLAIENEKLRSAVEWALGANGDFEPRPEGAGQYWWRHELQIRAGLHWDGEKYVSI